MRGILSQSSGQFIGIFFFTTHFYKILGTLYNGNFFYFIGGFMKKVVLLLVSVLAITACSQSKNIYFNGAEGSHSGIRYSTTDKSFSLNP